MSYPGSTPKVHVSSPRAMERGTLAAYLRRPEIYFYFSLPLVAPALFLIVFTLLEGGPSPAFLVIGWIMLLLALVCGAFGSYLCIDRAIKSSQDK